MLPCPACQQENPENARFCQGCGAPLPDLSADPGGLVGKVLSGRYRVTRVIAEGGMGVVYEAEQKMGDNVRRLAVKALLPALSQDPSIVKRFHRESGLVAQLEHPNTIRLYDFGTTPDGRLYIAMELVEGRPLTNDIEAGPIPMDRALRILKQICGALAEAHHLGIVHRDLKPDNVILTDRAGEQDFVKLLDFGIAKRTGDVGDHRTKITQAGMVLGTPPYMSPEQLAGEEVDARSDVYSLGVLAYEIVTGRLPFDADSPWEWASKHMTAVPLSPRTVTNAPIPERVEAAILHALAKRREDRPQDVLSFLAELSGAVQRISAPKTQMAPVLAPIRTESAVAAPLPPPAPRASRLGWVLASFGVLIGAGLSGFAYYQLREAPPEPVALLPSAEPPAAQIAPIVEGAEGLESTPALQPPQPNQSKAPPPKPQTGTKPPAATSPPAPPPTVVPPPATTSPSVTPPPATTTPPVLPPPPVTPPTPVGPQGDEACAQAQGAARSGNIEGAASLYHRCQSTGGSAAALTGVRRRIRDAAPREVRRRAFLGDCAGAKRAANAASSVGEGGGQSALAGTSCA